MSTALHPDVEEIGRRFTVLGAATPSAFGRKAELLLTPNMRGEKVVAVVGDAVRCSATILAAFASGVLAMTIATKSGKGPTLEDSRSIGERLGLPTVLAGELGGQPIPGGVLGNSPREATPEKLAGRLVAFRSTNFGAQFYAVTKWADQFRKAGGVPTVAVAGFANLAATAQWINAFDFDRVVVATGGFYDVISEEDLYLAGDLIAALAIPTAAMDDEARIMVDVAQHRRDADLRLDHFRKNWIGQALASFGVAADIPAATTGAGIAPTINAAMQRQLLIVTWIDGVPVIAPAAPTN